MSSPEQFELLPKVAEGIKLLNELDVKVVVATNQSGIARGYFSKEDLKRIHKRMIDELLKRGAKIDAIYYCPHHPNDNCGCRKPRIGMLERAARNFALDLSRCFVVGDKKLDIETGRNAGCMSILVPGPETEPNVEADYVAADLHEAARFVRRRMTK
jgi:histidinol-phosphate phosphatase family protein